MERPTRYQTAFYLSILSGVITFILFDIVFRAATPAIYFFGLPLAIPFGLWVKSNFVRGLGAVYLVIVAGSLLWPVVSSNFVLNRLPLAALYIFLTGINLCRSNLLLSGLRSGINNRNTSVTFGWVSFMGSLEQR